MRACRQRIIATVLAALIISGLPMGRAASQEPSEVQGPLVAVKIVEGPGIAQIVPAPQAELSPALGSHLPEAVGRCRTATDVLYGVPAKAETPLSDCVRASMSFLAQPDPIHRFSTNPLTQGQSQPQTPAKAESQFTMIDALKVVGVAGAGKESWALYKFANIATEAEILRGLQQYGFSAARSQRLAPAILSFLRKTPVKGGLAVIAVGSAGTALYLTLVESD